MGVGGGPVSEGTGRPSTEPSGGPGPRAWQSASLPEKTALSAVRWGWMQLWGEDGPSSWKRG